MRYCNETLISLQDNRFIKTATSHENKGMEREISRFDFLEE